MSSSLDHMPPSDLHPDALPALQAEIASADRFSRRLLRDRRVRIGLVCTVPVVALAVIGPNLAPASPTEFMGAPFSLGVPGATFGTDDLGRDVLSRSLSGGRQLVLLSILGTLVGVLPGAIIGVVSAYLGGWADELISRAADVALAFPPIVLALLFLSFLGPSPWLLMLVVALGHTPRTLRVMRGAAMGLVERDFVQYNVAIGARRRHIVLRELLPNVTGPLMVELGVRFTFSVGLIASLSFLGVGSQPPTPDWGMMINENRVGMTVQPWGVILPLTALAVLVVGCNLLTDGYARVAGIIKAKEAG